MNEKFSLYTKIWGSKQEQFKMLWCLPLFCSEDEQEHEGKNRQCGRDRVQDRWIRKPLQGTGATRRRVGPGKARLLVKHGIGPLVGSPELGV